jgi:hypothetical protein
MARNGVRTIPLPTVSWLVVRNRLCVPLSTTDDLLTDTAAIIEDMRATIADSSKLIAEAKRLVAESRGGQCGCPRQPDLTVGPPEDRLNADPQSD